MLTEKGLKKLRIITIFYHYSPDWIEEYEKNNDNSKDWIEEQKRISGMVYRDSSYMTEFLEISLRAYKIFPCSRLNIFFTDSKNKWKNSFSLCDSVCDMYIDFDMRYLTFTNEEKKEYLLTKLAQAFLEFCAQYSLDETPIKEVFFRLKNLLSEKNMLGPYKISGYKRLRQNGISAQLISYHDMNMYHFLVLLSSPVIGKVEIPFFTTLPGGLNTLEALGNFYWKDDQTLCVESSFKDNPFATPKEIRPDKLLDVTEYRLTHNQGKNKKNIRNNT